MTDMTTQIRLAKKRRDRDEEPLKKRKTKSVLPDKVVKKAKHDFEKGPGAQ